MPPVVLLKTPVDIGALDTTLEVDSNSSPSEQSAIQQCVKTQQAIQESCQREAQTFRAAPALQAFLAAQAAADGQCLMGPVAALKEQIAAAQAHIAPLIESHWKEDQERAQKLAASFQPLIDSRWTEAQERLQTLGAPLKAIHERVREAFQLFQPIQHEVLLAKKAFQGLAAPYQALFRAWQARTQPFLEQMTAIQALLALLKDNPKFQEELQRTRDIFTMQYAALVSCIQSQRPHWEAFAGPGTPGRDQMDLYHIAKGDRDWLTPEEQDAALHRLAAQAQVFLVGQARDALAQRAREVHLSPRELLRQQIVPAAVLLVIAESDTPQRLQVGQTRIRTPEGRW